MNSKIEQYKILLGQIFAHSMLVPMVIYASLQDWIISFFIYFLMMTFGISILNHRMLSHRAIEIKSKLLKLFCLFITTITLQGSSLVWVAMHREHHAHSDTERDPHSPSNEGFFKSYFLSMMYLPKIKRYALDLLRDKDIVFFHKHYWKINIIYFFILLSAFGPMGPVIFYLVPAVLQWHGSSIINGLAHYHKKVPKIIGYRNFETNELSKNLPLFAFLTFGEGWHNNHHGKPANFTFQHKWYEVDFIAEIIILFSKIKLIKIND